MREWINLVESDHPHARGEDEWFSMLFGQYSLNVDEARRLIASGSITVTDYDMPVKKAGEMLLSLDESEFGSNSTQRPRSVDALATHFSRDHFSSIPADKMDEPALMVMWNALRANPKQNRGMPDKPYPVLVDGNHRLAMRYLAGDTGSMKCWVIQDWNDIVKFSYDRSGKKLPPYKG